MFYVEKIIGGSTGIRTMPVSDIYMIVKIKMTFSVTSQNNMKQVFKIKLVNARLDNHVLGISLGSMQLHLL